MEIKTFLSNLYYYPKIAQSIKLFKEVSEKIENEKQSLTIFTIISDTYYYENMHSQIIATFLNPEANHGEKRKFLDLFLYYLKEIGIIINEHNYKNVKVETEHYYNSNDDKRRIDILIQGERHAIIIENKINNAVDMPNQLPAYYKYCHSKGLEVDAILYISLDGYKEPDRSTWEVNSSDEINSKIIRMAAYDTGVASIGNGWLQKCIESSKSDDNKLILKHYIQLLKKLRGTVMETSILGQFYEEINTLDENKSILQDLVNAYNALPQYYPERLNRIISTSIELNGLFKSIKVWQQIELIIGGIWNTNHYYLKIIFENEKVIFRIMNESKDWDRDEILKNGNFFQKNNYKEDFYYSTDFWEKLVFCDLTNMENFDKYIVQEVVLVLNAYKDVSTSD